MIYDNKKWKTIIIKNWLWVDCGWIKGGVLQTVRYDYRNLISVIIFSLSFTNKSCNTIHSVNMLNNLKWNIYHCHHGNNLYTNVNYVLYMHCATNNLNCARPNFNCAKLIFDINKHAFIHMHACTHSRMQHACMHMFSKERQNIHAMRPNR